MIMYVLYQVLLYFQVSVALTFCLDDVRSMGCTENNIKFADELHIDFSTGARQVITNSSMLQSTCMSGLANIPF